MAIMRITVRAALEMDKIREYSANAWGKQRATRYIEDMEKTLALLEEQPKVLLIKPEISEHLMFYVSGEHVLVFYRVNDDIYLVSVMHSKMDLSGRIRDLEPTLMREVEAMHVGVERSRGLGN